MSAASEGATSGTWRKGEFVLWSDLLAPLHASLVWFGLLVIAFMLALPALISYGISAQQIQAGLPNAIRSPAGIQFLTGTVDLIMLFFVWRVARRVADSSLVARFRAVSWPALLLAALAGVAFAVFVMFGIGWLAMNYIVEFHPKSGERLVAPGPVYQYVIVFVTVALIAPLTEEFYFRGLLLSWLRAKITIVPAALVSAAIFALVHFRFSGHPGAEGWVFTGVIYAVGLVNATLAAWTRSLWPSFALHAAYNGTLFAVAMAALSAR